MASSNLPQSGEVELPNASAKAAPGPAMSGVSSWRDLAGLNPSTWGRAGEEPDKRSPPMVSRSPTIQMYSTHDTLDEAEGMRRRFESTGDFARRIAVEMRGDVPRKRNFIPGLDALQDFRGKKLLTTLLPCVKWLASYDYRADLKDDFIAGITVGVMIIPQSMAYAIIAGLPAQNGLYSSVVPIIVYCVFGSSRQLAIGPVALVSLLVESGLSTIDIKDPDEYVGYATTLAFMCGCFQFFLGAFQLGFVVNFLSHAVISGFTSAAAITIGLSQLKYMVGYSIEKDSSIYVTLKSAVDGLGGFRWGTFVMGMICLGTLLTLKHLGKTVPKLKMLRAIGPLLVCFSSIIVVSLTRWNEHGVEVVGNIPSGFPPFNAGLRWDKVGELLGVAITISFVGFMESVSIAKSLAAKNKYELSANQELTGLGLANAVGAFFGAYPVTGSFSRSAVNNDTGAKSGIAAMTTACCVLVTLLALTEALYFLPKNALAAIVISAVSTLVDTDEAKFLWKVSKRDFCLWGTSFIGTLFLGVELGIAIAVGLSLVLVIYESARPHIAELGRIPGTTVYRSTKQYQEAITYEGIIILRIDAPIYFANTAFVKDKLREYELMVTSKRTGAKEEQACFAGSPLRFVILEMSPITSIDSTGIHALKDILQEYKTRGISFEMANPRKNVLESLALAGILPIIGAEEVFLRVHDAVLACLHTMGVAEENEQQQADV